MKIVFLNDLKRQNCNLIWETLFFIFQKYLAKLKTKTRIKIKFKFIFNTILIVSSLRWIDDELHTEDNYDDDDEE